MQIMEKKNCFCLLFVAFLLLKGTCMYAQESLGDKYAWRLDSVVYSYPTYTAEDDQEEVRSDHYTAYRYADDTLEVLSVERFTRKDSTYVFLPRKTLYIHADSGLYLKEYTRSSRYYNSMDSLKNIQFHSPTTRELYFRNDYRNVYDEEGHLLRQIRNYDYILYQQEKNLEDGTVSWYEDSRYIRQEDDESSMEKVYYYNYDADSAWVPQLSKSLYCRYTDHRLSYKETKNVYTWHANGKPATHNVAYARYNRLGVQTESGTISESWNTNGDSLSFTSEVKAFKAGVEQSTTTDKRTYAYDSTGVLQKKTVQHLFWPAYNYGGGYYLTDTVYDITDTYTYNEAGELSSLSRYENDYDAGTRLTYRQKYTHWDGGKWVTDSDVEWMLVPKKEGGKEYRVLHQFKFNSDGEEVIHHVIEYDSLGRETLNYDSTFSYLWECIRKEYQDGKLTLERKRYVNEGMGGWFTNYEMSVGDRYTETMTINWNQSRTINGVTYRDTLRHTNRVYHNGFDTYEKVERLNLGTGEWDLWWCKEYKTLFTDEGTPMSAMELTSPDGGLSWNPTKSYAFSYDADMQCFIRRETTKPYDETFFLSDGTYIGERYTWDGKKVGDLRQDAYDEQGRKEYEYHYSYTDSTQTWDLSWMYKYIYFPEPNTAVQAVWQCYNIDEDGNPVLEYTNKEKATRTFNAFDEFGNFTEKHAYSWGGNALVCDTVIYYRYTYNEAGQMTDCVKYRQYNNGVKSNEPMQKYHYFYHEDGTRFPCYTWQDYKGDGLWTNKAGLTQSGLGYVRTDGQGRTLENIYYSTDSTGLILTPKERNLFYYEGDEIDWIRKESFTWSVADYMWKEAGETSRLAGAQGTYHLDERGNLIAREEANGLAWECTYGASLEDYPVLQPSALGVQDETDLFTALNGVQPASRLLTIHHKGNSKRAFSLTNNYYMARFYYTQFREEVDTVKTELEEEITVEPEENTATFTWPAVSGGMSYTLIIWADKERTEKVCALQLAADGTLLEIDFSKAPRRAPATCWAAPVLNTTIENLLAGTKYWYTLEAYDEVGLLLETTYGTFTTAQSTEGIIDVQRDDVQCTKFLRNGQIIIRRGDAEYTIQGNQFK